MNDYVVDTNVWAIVDRIDELQTPSELECASNCLTWLNVFSGSEDRLVVDDGHKILTEYYNNCRAGGTARVMLNRINSEPYTRLIQVHIKYDVDNCAIVPPELNEFDRSDRRFVAVALERDPIPPIINATDTDWAKAKTELEAVGIFVQELCTAYIQDKLSSRA